MDTKIAAVIEELETIEAENREHAKREAAFGGNVVKETSYKSTAAGVRIAINVLRERAS